VALQSVAGHRIGEDTRDLERWLRDLSGCPAVTHTHVLACRNEKHDEPAVWFYVEADSGVGVLRRRCLACGEVAASLDSDARWTFPPMWACNTCGQSITEVAAGLHSPGSDDMPGPVSWAAIGVRCVGCGALAGVADFVLPALPYDEVTAAL
jgi:hypothetical protein